jgi:hypothetical protein
MGETRMLKSVFGSLLIALFGMAAAVAAFAQSPAAGLGTWTGMAAQNKGKTGYTVVMTISADAGETEYPDLKCGGKLTQVGAANGYVFYTETITHGGVNSGGGCIDGTITMMPASGKLLWGWIGAYNNETIVAWATLTQK